MEPRLSILRPGYDADDIDFDLPQFYLAGPVLGGGDWQARMCSELLSKTTEGCTVVVPCRWDDTHPLKEFFVGVQGPYERQLEWEQKYLHNTLVNSGNCVILWFAKEDARNPRSDGNPYGRDTYGEQGYFRGILQHKGDIRLVMGGDHSFPGIDVIKRNWNHTYGDVFPFYESLDDLAQAAFQRTVSW